jgi:hypothetical protein
MYEYFFLTYLFDLHVYLLLVLNTGETIVSLKECLFLRTVYDICFKICCVPLVQLSPFTASHHHSYDTIISLILYTSFAVLSIKLTYIINANYTLSK